MANIKMMPSKSLNILKILNLLEDAFLGSAAKYPSAKAI